jgi:hypothetical protein
MNSKVGGVAISFIPVTSILPQLDENELSCAVNIPLPDEVKNEIQLKSNASNANRETGADEIVAFMFHVCLLDALKLPKSKN